jgi:hypothetical protein
LCPGSNRYANESLKNSLKIGFKLRITGAVSQRDFGFLIRNFRAKPIASAVDISMLFIQLTLKPSAQKGPRIGSRPERRSCV